MKQKGNPFNNSPMAPEPLNRKECADATGQSEPPAGMAVDFVALEETSPVPEPAFSPGMMIFGGIVDQIFGPYRMETELIETLRAENKLLYEALQAESKRRVVAERKAAWATSVLEHFVATLHDKPMGSVDLETVRVYERARNVLQERTIA